MTVYCSIAPSHVNLMCRQLCNTDNNHPCKQTRNADPMSVLCWSTVHHAGSKLNKLWVNVPYLLERLTLSLLGATIVIFNSLADPITVVWVIFAHLKLWFAVAKSNLKWVKSKIFNLAHQPFTHQIIQFEFSPTWSCVSLTRSTTSSEWKLFRFDKMEVISFQILLADGTFYL